MEINVFQWSEHPLAVRTSNWVSVHWLTEVIVYGSREK